MKFCAACGAAVTQRIPAGDNRLRHVCTACETIHYKNPTIITGCIPVYGDQVLLCRRAIEPRYGFWTLPAGFLELDETIAEGAARETWEEAEAAVEITQLYRVYNLADIGQVYMMHIAQLPELKFAPQTSESLEVRLFREEGIPWQDMAFRTVANTLKDYFDDRRAGRDFAIKVEDLPPR